MVSIAVNLSHTTPSANLAYRTTSVGEGKKTVHRKGIVETHMGQICQDHDSAKNWSLF